MNIPPQVQHSLLILAILIATWLLRRVRAFLRALRNGTVRLERGGVYLEWRDRHGRLRKIEFGHSEPFYDNRRHNLRGRDTATAVLITGDVIEE